jgi:hypothetical protein
MIGCVLNKVIIEKKQYLILKHQTGRFFDVTNKVRLLVGLRYG